MVTSLCLLQGCSKDPVAREIQQLRDSDDSVRIAAAEALGESNDPRAIKPLIAALGDSTSDVRSAAEQALVKLCTSEKELSNITLADCNWRLFDLTIKPFVAKDVFIDVLVSEETIAALLATLRTNLELSSATIDSLLDDVNESNLDKRLAVIKIFGEIKDPRSMSLLVSCLKDSEPQRVQETAIQALAQMDEIVIEILLANGPSSGEPLLVLANSPNEDLKQNALKALVKLGIERVLTNSIGLKLVSIPPGEFIMGSPTPEEYRNSNEGPQHRVHISKCIYMADTEVTQAQYQAVMGTNPSHFRGSTDLPVENVSWHDAVEFCQRLSQKEGRPYRLPTEAEWEYACRAGTTTAFCFGRNLDASVANYDGNYPNGKGRKGPYRQKTVSVKTYKPNMWGLCNMHGNVYEWCGDWYGENYYSSSPSVNPKGPSIGQFRVVRGGSWRHYPENCRSAHRYWFTPDIQSNSVGFRIVLDLN